MFGDKILRKFETLCGIPEDSDEPLRIAEIRQLLLFRSSGLCPARLLLSKEDGSPLSRKQVCTAETLKWAKRKSWFDFGDFEKLKRDAVKKEEKFIGSPSYQCILSATQQNKLQALVMQSGGDCKAFRRQLLASTEIEAVAIHFFRWDGTPRQSVAEVEKAVCMYPSSPSKMSTFLKVFMAVVVSAVALTAYKVVSRELKARTASDSTNSNTQRADVKTLTCPRDRLDIHLVGEFHNGGPFSDKWLSRFLRKLDEEGSNPTTIVFVEKRPWDYEDVHPFTDDALEYKKVLMQALITDNALSFWEGALLNKAVILPNHDIIPYDYRYIPLDDAEKEGNVFPRLMEDNGLVENYREVLLEHRHNMERSFKIQLDLLKKFQNGPGRGEGALMNPFVKTFASRINTFTQNFDKLSRNDAQTLLTQLFNDWNGIADHTLVALISSMKRTLVSKGITDIYVFMGKEHVDWTEKLLCEYLSCETFDDM